MKIIFEGKSGIFGQYGWKPISFWKWLGLIKNHVTRVRFIRRPKYVATSRDLIEESYGAEFCKMMEDYQKYLEGEQNEKDKN